MIVFSLPLLSYILCGCFRKGTKTLPNTEMIFVIFAYTLCLLSEGSLNIHRVYSSPLFANLPWKTSESGAYNVIPVISQNFPYSICWIFQHYPASDIYLNFFFVCVCFKTDTLCKFLFNFFLFVLCSLTLFSLLLITQAKQCLNFFSIYFLVLPLDHSPALPSSKDYRFSSAIQ